MVFLLLGVIIPHLVSLEVAHNKKQQFLKLLIIGLRSYPTDASLRCCFEDRELYGQTPAPDPNHTFVLNELIMEGALINCQSSYIHSQIVFVRPSNIEVSLKMVTDQITDSPLQHQAKI